MTLLIDTAEVPASDRAQFWAAESGCAYHPLQITVGPNDRFAARMWGERLSQIRLFRIVAGANTMSRTNRHIAAGDPECMHLELLLRGSLYGAQCNRTVVLRPGDMMVYDTSRTAVFRSDGPFDLLVVQISKSLLGRSANTFAKQVAVRIPGESGLPRVAARFLLETAGGLAGGGIDPDDAGLEGHVMDLVRRLYADLDSGTSPRQPHSTAELLLNAQAQIESRLSDPTLAPSEIAQACFISTRYLHRVFADEGVSVCDFIRSERLARCRRDLLDPGLADLPIQSVASRWGLPNPSHFSRLFRERYGCSPREFRATRGAAARRAGDRAAGTARPSDAGRQADAWKHANWQALEVGEL